MIKYLVIEFLSGLSISDFLIILIAGWTFYKNFIESSKISIHSGDSIDIVKASDCETDKVQIACTFNNNSMKAGIINQVAIIVKKAGSSHKYIFKWHIFYEYEAGHRSIPKSKVCPIPVPGNNSIFQGIQFITEDGSFWEEGDYEFEIMGWVGNRSILKHPSTKETFSVSLCKKFIEDLKNIDDELTGTTLHSVMINDRDILLRNDL